MRKYYLYILLCADNSYYTGMTEDLELRIKQHNDGFYKDSYTYNKRPIKLVFHEEFQGAESARKLEKQIKGWTRKKKEALINGDWDLLKELSECKNDTHYKISKF